MRKYLATACALAALAFALPASASTVIASGCSGGVTAAKGCLFEKNINSNPDATNVNSYKSAENAYNALSFADITLNFVADFTPGSSGQTSGTWSAPGKLISFIAVKASDKFVLYQLATPASSGTWNTFDIPFASKSKGKGPSTPSYHGLSHLMLFSTAVAVPEPSTWAYLMLGFGALGAAMRRRRQVLRFA